MPYQKIPKILTGLAAILVMISATNADTSGILSIQANGFSSDNGKAVINLFRAEDNILNIKKAYRQVTATIQNGCAAAEIDDLNYGKYAVSIFHDETGNNELDHNVLGFPAEPLGFSNNFRLSLFSGMPTFEKLQFSFTTANSTLKISLK